MQTEQEQIIAMAIAAIAEELHEQIPRLRVLSFREVHKSSLEEFLAEHHIQYKKYQLGEEA